MPLSALYALHPSIYRLSRASLCCTCYKLPSKLPSKATEIGETGSSFFFGVWAGYFPTWPTHVYRHLLPTPIRVHCNLLPTLTSVFYFDSAAIVQSYGSKSTAAILVCLLPYKTLISLDVTSSSLFLGHNQS